MTPNFVVVDSVLLSICCYIGRGMSFSVPFVEEDVMLFGAITDKGV